MQNKIGVITLVVLAIINSVVAGSFSLSNAIISTAIGLFFSITWLIVFSKVLEDKNNVVGLEGELSYKNLLILLAPGIIYYLSLWGLIVAVYVLYK